MIQFAVQTPFDVEAKNGLARWVLAVDPATDRFLVSNSDRGFTWVAIDECRYIKMINPEMPIPVIGVMPQSKSGLVRGNPGSIPPVQN